MGVFQAEWILPLGMGNADRIRRAYEALNEGDPYVFLEMYAAEIELYVPTWVGLESGVFRGSKAVERWYGHQFAQWRDVRYELDQVIEWGPHVTVFARWIGTGRRSGVALESDFLNVFSFEGDRIVSIAQLGGAGMAQPV